MSDLSTAVLAKSLQVAQTQAAGNQNLISNVAPMQVIQDPALGNKVNLLA
ncbi:MAG: hypothetical protein H7246_21020 [Phycisphaerae bacterium]|nr:hypothetical protein [Saprospiraceae bacterium]